mgnify:FL=1
MENGLNGWTASGLWHLTTESSQNCFPEPYPSSQTVAYYGQDSTCNYDTGSANSGNLDRIVPISGISPNSELLFWFVNGNEGMSDYDISEVFVSPDNISWTQVWTWAGNQQPTWTQTSPIPLTSWANQSIYLRFRFNTIDSISNNYLGWAIDNIQINSSNWQCNVCQINPPGKIINTLTISKSDGYLILTWNIPGGICYTTGYALYRGTLPWEGYNHVLSDCNINNTTYTIPQDNGNYYFLVVANNAISEGSYGNNSDGNEIPQSSLACVPQDTMHCN